MLSVKYGTVVATLWYLCWGCVLSCYGEGGFKRVSLGVKENSGTKMIKMNSMAQAPLPTDIPTVSHQAPVTVLGYSSWGEKQ